MQGSSSVIASLNVVYSQCLTWKEQSHRQENRFEAIGWKGLKKKFDKMTQEVHNLNHYVLDRIEQLNGEPNSMLGPVQIANDAQGAFSLALITVTELCKAISSAIDVSVADKDRVTEEMLYDLYEVTEERVLKIEKQLRKISALQIPLYLGTHGG